MNTDQAFARDLEALFRRGLIEVDEDLPGEVDGRARVQLTAAGRAESASQSSQTSGVEEDGSA